MIPRRFLDRYEVLRPLGEGGMGRVYLAREPDQDRAVVIKVMHERLACQPRFLATFRREMQFMRRFQHPNVVALLDASVDGPDGPCIVMEYINGMPLYELLERHRRLDPERVGRLLTPLCGALHAAHAHGIIHRDLKPDNVMVVNADTVQETIKVMDFGLSKLADVPHIDLAKFDRPDSVIARGTPEYMCPEQVRGDELDARGDLYSVGVMLFELLTGRLPFVRPTVMEILRAQVEEDPPTFTAVGAADAVHPDVEKVVRHCLAKFPNERPQSARELLQRYIRALGEKPSPAEEKLVAAGETPGRTTEVTFPAEPEAEPVKLDPNTVVQHLEAWMPERIALIKLRGFAQDFGGEIVDSVPGMIRFRLGGPRCPYRIPILGWKARLGLVPGAGQINLQLLLAKRNPAQQQLKVTVLLSPAVSGPQSTQVAHHPDWPVCCEQIYRDLRSYLMGKSG
jgi:eukaryotic-like serine/threonine-protein kinase